MLAGPSFIPSVVKSIVIFLHGFGSNGDDLFDLVDYFKPHMLHTAFYSPNALEDCPGNPFEGYQWFGLPDLAQPTLQMGLDKAGPKVSQYIQMIADKHHLKTDDVIVIGFSQGCMVALDQAFRIPLKAVIGYSGIFVPPHATVIAKPETPVLLVHGTHDTVVPYPMLATSVGALHLYGVEAAQVTCPNLGHSIDALGLKEALKFINLVNDDKPVIYL